MTTFRIEGLISLIADLAESAGVMPRDAVIFASALVDAEVRGVTTHGLSRLSIYLQRIEKGLIDPKAELTVERDTGNVLALNAGNGLGQVQAVKTLDLLTPLARRNGIAAATIRNSQHFGALSYYCNLAADDGFILLAMSNGEPAMSPEGGYEPFFGTNPIAASFPSGKGFNVSVDMATSVVARGRIIAASKQKIGIPEGWALDAEGNRTTNPEAALRGTVLTMAGHKGSALALMIESFSGVLSGSAIGSDVGSMYKDLDRRQDVGHFFCLLDIEAFLGVKSFRSRMDQTIDRIKACKRRPGVDEIFVPGERSAARAAANREFGIPLQQDILADIESRCTHYGVAFELPKVTT